MVAPQLGYPPSATTSILARQCGQRGLTARRMMVRHRVLAGYAAPYCSRDLPAGERSITSIVGVVEDQPGRVTLPAGTAHDRSRTTRQLGRSRSARTPGTTGRPGGFVLNMVRSTLIAARPNVTPRPLAWTSWMAWPRAASAARAPFRAAGHGPRSLCARAGALPGPFPPVARVMVTAAAAAAATTGCPRPRRRGWRWARCRLRCRARSHQPRRARWHRRSAGRCPHGAVPRYHWS